MPRTQLRETVKQLQQTLDEGVVLSPEQRDALGDALSEIERLLESDDEALGENASIVAKLREAEAHFEDSHPNLTIAVGAVAEALANLGI